MIETACPFCNPESNLIFHASSLTLGIWDGFPVSLGHALLVPKRHVADWFSATPEEQADLLLGISRAREEIEKLHQPHGYNIGINIDEAAGQTVPHLHVHIIPRYRGDVTDPRGGVRYVIPDKANYLAAAPAPMVVADTGPGDDYTTQLGSEYPHANALITGDEDPLLPHILQHLDSAGAADLAVAFLLRSGVRLLREHLLDLLERGGRLRVLTGTYMGVTDPLALLELLDLQEAHPENFELYAFDASSQSFHPKSYLFYQDPARTEPDAALVGSSNLSRTALTEGVEWNFRTIPSRDRTGFSAVVSAFEALLNHPKIQTVTPDWVGEYSSTRRPEPNNEGVQLDAPEKPPDPHPIQKEALAALEATRAAGNSAALVVLATGLGKTWLSAFDCDRPEYQRVLFVAHREEILRQAMDTYRRIRPEAYLGLYAGQEKTPRADVVFASIQTLGRQAHLNRFDRQDFDYVVVDEFHHAAAATYRRLLSHFEPKFLLGLTATPERTDGGDLLALCQENLAFRCDVGEGIHQKLLSPFHYFGVPDEVDYANIPWRSRRFDEEALTNAVATQSRAENALDQYRLRGGEQTLGFCCSKRHADFMKQFFADAGVRCASVHSGPESDPRAGSLERLSSGELDVVFAVDMFNEGVDLPNVDTVMMLRPTESRILWLQQFGRGLRKSDAKSHLTVIDYIGNHRTFLLKPQTLFNLGAGDAEIARQLERLDRGEVELPPGCEVTYELEAVEILKSLLRLNSGEEAIRLFYEDFRERHGVRPTASEMHHEGYRPRSLRTGYGSWFGFVDALGDLSNTQRPIVRDEGAASKFLRALETTEMTKSYKILVLLAMIQAGRFPGEISIAELREEVRRTAKLSALLQADLGVPLDDESALERKLVQNPIAAWTGGRGTGGSSYFEFSNGVFRSTISGVDRTSTAFVELVSELAEWRLAAYLDRASTADAPLPEAGIRCRVSHSNGKPIFFLPDRSKSLDMPRGWTTVQIDGQHLEANFVKVAVNVVRRPGEAENILPEIARGWFGEHAGLPGTGHQVRLVESKGEWSVEPASRVQGGNGLQIGRSYMRADIPAQYGLEFMRTVWEQGVVMQGGSIFLLVTLNKAGMPKDHQYGDHFLSHDVLEWKSQNKHSQKGNGGQALKNHAERDVPVRLLIRKEGKIDGKAAPFIYCGEVDFVDWEGEKPITVRWKLQTPLTKALAELFDAPDT